MSKQFTVNLSPRQLVDVYGFVTSTVQPKGRQEARALQGVFETFGLDKIQAQVEALAPGTQVLRTEFSDKPEAIETGSVDLNTLLDYLDKPGATAIGSLKLLAVTDELLRAKEGRALQSIPEEKGA